MAKMNHNNNHSRNDYRTNTVWSIDHDDATTTAAATSATTSLSNGCWKCVSIIFVRHGIALHNVIQQQQQPQQHAQEQQLPLQQEHNNNNNSSDDDEEQILFDPQLTVQGKFQAVVIGETIYNYLLHQKHHHVHQPQQQQVQQQWNLQIITSPLTRCIQTSMYAFGIPPITTYSYHDISSQMNVNHTNTSSLSRTNAVRGCLHCHPTIICHEQLREAHGIYVCDKRRTRTQLKQIWSSRCTIQYVDSHNNNSNNYNNTIGCYEMTNEDILWQRHVRETIHELQIRIHQFLSWLVAFSLSSSSPPFNDPHPINATAPNSRSAPPKEATTITNSNTTNTNNIYIVVSHGVWIETMLQMYDPTWSIPITTNPSITTTIPTTIGGIHPSPLSPLSSSSSHPPPPPPPPPRRIYNGDMYYCDCYYYHQPTTTSRNTTRNTNWNATNIQMQNVHQIPPLSNYS